MTLHTLLISTHITFGSLVLIIGFVNFLVKKRKGIHTIVGKIYHALYLGLILAAIALSLLDWANLWWFLPISIFSYAFAILGYVAAKNKQKNWLYRHVIGQCGSYIALITAVLVVAMGQTTWWVWIVPSIVGSAFVTWMNNEIIAGRRPKL